MANIDLKKAATTDYVAGDEYLTKSSSGELNWTPAHQAPYELLEDDIISKTNTKGLVSGDQLSRLIPDIPELTQANIDDKDDVSGTVNPSKVSFGGGDEVLKDWTRVVSPQSINLLGSVDLSQGTNGLTVEFRDLAIDNVIGPWNGRLAWNTESNELPVDKRESLTHTVVGQASPVVVNRHRPSDFSNNFMYAPNGAGAYQLSAQVGNMTIELESLTRTIGGSGLSTATAYVTSGAIISWIPSFATANGVLKSYSIVQGNSKNTTPFTKLFLGWDSGATVDYEYRVIRK